MKEVWIRIQDVTDRRNMAGALALQGYQVRVEERKRFTGATISHFLVVHIPENCIINDGDDLQYSD